VTLKADRIGREIGLTLYTPTPQNRAGFAPIAIGFTAAVCSLLGGSVSGGAFNPARVFAPAIFSNVWTHQWLYWIVSAHIYITSVRISDTVLKSIIV